ncbi:MAG: selenoneine biosynthesis selenosugar synthase SenB [Planctomycetota bacterium]|jgi:putative glycosyltransferase (TIGR04348 family)
MKILIVTPASLASTLGNSVTARRWAGLLQELGHQVEVSTSYEGQNCDLLIALHARRSHGSVLAYRAEHPEGLLIVALTGTDLYQDLPGDEQAQESLRLADRLVVLQAKAIESLPEELRGKVAVIHQSAVAAAHRPLREENVFEISVLGHMRKVKDPLRAAYAARTLPMTSRIRVLQVGAALEPEMAAAARAEERANARYRWLGEKSAEEAQQVLMRSRLMVLSSRMEGGSNVISEAIACGIPVLSSRIPGSIGQLGEKYPGYFPVGDTQVLAWLMERVESDRSFYRLLGERCAALRETVDPQVERERWAELLANLAQ